MRRRAAIAAALACALGGVPGTAGAQTGEPRAVVGGGTFNTAARLSPGTYRDTVLPNENLFYAIAVRSGQTLSATLELDDVDERTYDLSTVSVMRVSLHGPLRDAHPRLTSAATDLEMYPIEVTSDPAQTLAGSVGQQYFTGPGTWYVSVAAGARDDVRVELPFVLRLDVTGDPVDEPRRAPAPQPAEAREPAEGDGDGDDDGPAAGAIAGLGAGGLVVGLVAGAALGRRRRR